MNKGDQLRYIGVIVTTGILVMGFATLCLILTLSKLQFQREGIHTYGTVIKLKRNGHIKNDYFIRLRADNKDSVVVIINASLNRAKIKDTVKIVFLPERMEAEFEIDSGFNFDYWILVISVLFLTSFLMLSLRYPRFILKYARGEIFHSS